MKKKIEKLILRAYGKKKYGESTLEIPNKTLVISCVISFVIALGISNIFLEILNGMAKNNLKSIKIPTYQHGEIVQKIRSVLPPDIKYKVRDEFDDFEPYDYLKNTNHVDFESLIYTIQNAYPNSITDIEKKEQFAQDIIGRIERLLIIPQFEASSTSKLLESYGISKPNLSKPKQSEINEVVSYAFISSLINKFRKELSADYGYPRRLLQALGGFIQFVTFFFAIWAFVLILLRIGWWWIQNRITESGHLLNDIELKSSIWEFDKEINPENSLLTKYRTNFGSGLLPVRLVDEVIALKNEKQLPADTGEFVNERFEQLESSVQKGEYEIINYLMFAIPNLGFIGTIIGIVISMSNISNIIESDVQLEQVEAFEKVGGALGLAFDTTAVSLFWVLILSLFLALLKKMEADLFEKLKEAAQVTFKYYLNKLGY